MKPALLFTAFAISAIPSVFSQNVGIGTSTPSLARLQINGSVGSAVAIFGADKFGVAIEADNPEIGFNYYFNNGARTIKAGKAAVAGMVPASGDFYIGNFSDNVSASDGGAIAGYRNAIVVKQSGRVGIGVDNPQRAFVEQAGSIGVNTAIFGGDGKGVSLQKDWPAIGLNHYFNGNHLSLGGGYGAQIGVNQNTGALYFAQFSNSAPLANGLLLNPISAINFKYGKIGVNTDDPQASIEIKNMLNGGGTSNPNAPFLGLRLTDENNLFWNIFTQNGLFFCHGGLLKAVMSSSDGAIYTYSDQRMKRNISAIEDGALHKVLNLHPSTYFMKDEPATNTQKHIGFMAQELQLFFPEVVTEDNNGMKMVNYVGLVPVLTKAIQEQQKTIEKQQQQIDWLMKRVQ